MILGAGQPGQVLGPLVPDGLGGHQLPGETLPQPLGLHGVCLRSAELRVEDVDPGLGAARLSLQSEAVNLVILIRGRCENLIYNQAQTQ